ncbi:unnamed protein product, partial [Polarella glacialis]
MATSDARHQLRSMLASLPPEQLPAPPQVMLSMLESMPSAAIEAMLRQFTDGASPESPSLRLPSATRSHVGQGNSASAKPQDKKSEEREAYLEVLKSCCTPGLAVEFEILNAEAALSGRASRSAPFKQQADHSDPLVRALQVHAPALASDEGASHVRQRLLRWGASLPRAVCLMRYELGLQAHRKELPTSGTENVMMTLSTNSTVVKPEADTRTGWQALCSVNVSDLQLFQVSSGRVLHGKLIVDPLATVGVTTILEDSAGSIVQLGLYNMLPGGPTGAKAHELAQHFFPKGTHLSIAEPFLKIFRDGNRGVRVDSPTDLRVERVSESNDLASLQRARECGNKLVKQGLHQAAASEYWQGLRSPGVETEVAQLLSNRSQALLKQGLWAAALADAAAALLLAPGAAKAWQRYVAALHGLSQPQLAQRATTILAKDELLPTEQQPKEEDLAGSVRSVLAMALSAALISETECPDDADVAKALSGEDFRAAGNAAYKSGDFRKATELYSRALAASQLAGDAALVLGNTALCALRANALHDAVSTSSACLRLRPNSPKAIFRLAQSLALLGELAMANMVLSAVGGSNGDAVLRSLKAEVSKVSSLYQNFAAGRGLAGVVELKAICDGGGGAGCSVDVLPDWISKDALAIKCLGSKGRGVVAARDILPAEVLMVQRPRVSASHGSLASGAEHLTSITVNTRLVNDGSRTRLKASVMSSLPTDGLLAAVLGMLRHGTESPQLAVPVWEDLLHRLG